MHTFFVSFSRRRESRQYGFQLPPEAGRQVWNDRFKVYFEKVLKKCTWVRNLE